MDYKFSEDGKRVQWTHTVSGVAGSPTVTLVAAECRKERTGFHAKIGISTGGFILGYDVFNIHRSEERGRLARRAHDRLDEQIQQGYPKLHLERDLDRFCLGLEQAWHGRLKPEVLSGQNVPPATFALRPFILAGGGTILFSPPGQGKSWITLLMAQSIQHGINSIWDVGDPAKVLFVNLERSRDSIQRRIAQANMALGLGPEAAMHTINARGSTLMELEDTIRAAMDREQYQVLFLDSISRTARGSLNEDLTANSVINALNGLVGDKSWFAIGHTAKNQDAGKSTIFGSMHFEAGCDIAVRLESSAEPEGMAVKLTMTKANDIRKPLPSVVYLRFDDGGLVSADPSTMSEFPALDGGPSVSDLMEEHLLAEGKTPLSNLASMLGRHRQNVERVLKAEPERFGSEKIGTTRYVWAMAKES
jgi:hypothetical protein